MAKLILSFVLILLIVYFTYLLFRRASALRDPFLSDPFLRDPFLSDPFLSEGFRHGMGGYGIGFGHSYGLGRGIIPW